MINCFELHNHGKLQILLTNALLDLPIIDRKIGFALQQQRMYAVAFLMKKQIRYVLSRKRLTRHAVTTHPVTNSHDDNVLRKLLSINLGKLTLIENKLNELLIRL